TISTASGPEIPHAIANSAAGFYAPAKACPADIPCGFAPPPGGSRSMSRVLQELRLDRRSKSRTARSHEHVVQDHDGCPRHGGARIGDRLARSRTACADPAGCAGHLQERAAERAVPARRLLTVSPQ